MSQIKGKTIIGFLPFPSQADIRYIERLPAFFNGQRNLIIRLPDRKEEDATGLLLQEQERNGTDGQ